MTPPAPLNKIGSLRIVDQNHDGVFNLGDRIESSTGKTLNSDSAEVKSNLGKLGIKSLNGLRLAPIFRMNQGRGLVDNYLQAGRSGDFDLAMAQVDHFPIWAESAGFTFDSKLQAELQLKVLAKGFEIFISDSLKFIW